ncbi:MAG: hypothetical protein ACKOW9_06200 [Candidatus Paceibacterota bacterium]
MAIIPLQYSNRDYVLNAFSGLEGNKDLLESFLRSVSCATLEEYSDSAALTWVGLENGILSVWSVLGRLFFLSEQSSDGRVLNIATPVSRIRRFSEEYNGADECIVTIELDADRASLDLLGASGEDGSVQLQGVFRHSGYSVKAKGEDASHLVYFAYRFRRYLKETV